MTGNDTNGRDGTEPRPAAVTFVTTEHFTLQGARAATIAESTSRATTFVGSVSAGLVALGLIATATRISTAFYAFGLVLLSTLSFVGFVTFQRVLQSGIEDHGYAERIARLRAYYFDALPGQRAAVAAASDRGFDQRVLAGVPDDCRDGWRSHSGADRLRCGIARRDRHW
jgi:hypothetical protein